MIFYGTNLGVLRSWKMAHDVAGAAMLAPFGLTAAEMTVITKASSARLHNWSTQSMTLVQPRAGLLDALHRQRPAAIVGFIADARTPASGPMVDRLAGELNRIVLESWCQAVRGGEKLARFELGQDDAEAIRQLPASRFEQWISLPIALGVPRPGLIQALHRDDRGMLLAFAKPWEEDNDDHRDTTITSRHGRPPNQDCRR
jgi:hypothetical protein